MISLIVSVIIRVLLIVFLKFKKRKKKWKEKNIFYIDVKYLECLNNFKLNVFIFCNSFFILKVIREKWFVWDFGFFDKLFNKELGEKKACKGWDERYRFEKLRVFCRVVRYWYFTWDLYYLFLMLLLRNMKSII